MKKLLSYSEFLNESNGAGDCYEAAGNLVLPMFGPKGNDYTLVHGMVNGQGSLTGIRYGHAWVESKDNVLDHSNGRQIEMSKSTYYKLGGIDKKDNIYYTVEEARKWILKTKHWGPWEMSGDPVTLSEGLPAENKDIGKPEMRVPNKILKKIKELI